MTFFIEPIGIFSVRSAISQTKEEIFYFCTASRSVIIIIIIIDNKIFLNFLNLSHDQALLRTPSIILNSFTFCSNP